MEMSANERVERKAKPQEGEQERERVKYAKRSTNPCRRVCVCVSLWTRKLRARLQRRVWTFSRSRTFVRTPGEPLLACSVTSQRSTHTHPEVCDRSGE